MSLSELGIVREPDGALVYKGDPKHKRNQLTEVIERAKKFRVRRQVEHEQAAGALVNYASSEFTDAMTAENQTLKRVRLMNATQALKEAVKSTDSKKKRAEIKVIYSAVDALK